MTSPLPSRLHLLARTALCASGVTIAFMEIEPCCQKRTLQRAMAEQQSVIRKSSQTLGQTGCQIRAPNPQHNATSRTKHSLMLTRRRSTPQRWWDCGGEAFDLPEWVSFLEPLTCSWLDDSEELIEKSTFLRAAAGELSDLIFVVRG